MKQKTTCAAVIAKPIGEHLLFFNCPYPTSFKRDGREVVCTRKGFGAGTGGCVGTAVAPDAICHTSAGLLLSGSSQQDAGTPLRPVPRAGGGARMFWRKYSTTEVVTTGNASGGTVFAFRGSFLPCKHSRDARVKGCTQGRLQVVGQPEGSQGKSLTPVLHEIFSM